MNSTSSDFFRILLAFAIIYLVWGSTYLANAWALQAFPPFVLAGLRFLIAGILLMGLSRFFGKIDFSWQQFKNAGIAGLLLFAMGNGLVVWSLQYVETGIAALVVAFEPLLVVLLMWKMKGEVQSWQSWTGLALGIIGMLFLVGQPHFVSDSEWLLGVLAIFGAIASWAYASIWMTTANLPKSLFQNAALQMLIGGFILMIMGGLNGEWGLVNWMAVQAKPLMALTYLVIVGSILAFTAFNYLLTKVSPSLIATSAYVNPVVALFLGWWLNAEKVSGQSGIAAFLLLAGVVLISWRKKA